MVHKNNKESTTNHWRIYNGAVKRGDAAAALEIARDAASRHEASGNLKHSGIWHRAVANSLYLQGRTDDAITAAKKSVKIQPDPYERALSYIAVGQMQTHAGKYRGAFAAFRESLRLAENYTDDSYLLSHLYGHRAIAYWRTGKYDSAIVDWEGAAELMKVDCQMWRAATYLNNIGFLLTTIGNLEEAEQRSLTALELLEYDPHAHTEAVTCDSLGYIYTLLGQHVNAERFLRRSARILQALGDETQLHGVFIHFSELRRRTHYYETAREDAVRALEIAARLKSETLIEEARNQLKVITMTQLENNLGYRLSDPRRLSGRLRKVKKRLERNRSRNDPHKTTW